MSKSENDRIDAIVDLLGCSMDEAMQILKDDKSIDRGERMSFDLSREQEKLAKKYANVREHTRKASTLNRSNKVERPPDTAKESVIEQISTFLNEKGYENVEILNKSKLISFKIGADTYKLDLIRVRKTK
jgi:hypothetical protein